jgi:hypothetical protein
MSYIWALIDRKYAGSRLRYPVIYRLISQFSI